LGQLRASGAATGRRPTNGQDQTTDPSARYRFYRAKRSGMPAVAAIEDRSWNIFRDTVDQEPSLRNDRADATVTAAAIAGIVSPATDRTWAPRVAAGIAAAG
jgi:hypothetical protein